MNLPFHVEGMFEILHQVEFESTFEAVCFVVVDGSSKCKYHGVNTQSIGAYKTYLDCGKRSDLSPSSQ